MTIILDTNVLISGIIAYNLSDSPPYQILLAWKKNHISLAVTDEIIDEYKRVSKYERLKKQPGYNPAKMNKMLQVVQHNAKHVESIEKLAAISKDPSDNKFLECAIAAKAEFVITGNTNHFTQKSYLGIRIVSPKEFIMYLQHLQSK